MKTRHYYLVLLIFSGFSLFAAKKPDAKSVYLQQLTAENPETSLTNFSSVQKGKAFVKMFHNEENVKIQISVPDESMQTKFLMQGLKVYVDISGKKSKKYRVQFPKFEREQMRGNMQQQLEPGQQGRQGGRMNMEQMIAMLSATNAELVNGRNKTLLEIEKANIRMIENNNMLFTFCLPLSLIGETIGKNQIISVGLSAEMDAPPAGMGPGGGPGGGGGGMRGGGGGGGMRGGGGGGMRSGGGGSGGDVGGDSGGGGGGGMRSGGGGSFSEMSTSFNAWVTFGL